MDKNEKIELANKIAKNFEGNAKVWSGGNTVRIYVQGYATIQDDGVVNIDAVKRADFGKIQLACDAVGVKYTR